MLDKRTIHIADLQAETAEFSEGSRIARESNFHSVLAVPLKREDYVVGVIALRRQEVQLFTEKQVELAQNFAAQAVIAIENTRLLNELRQSLQQQTATADVLKTISRSTFDLQSVLDTLTISAATLCEAETAGITRQKDNAYYYAATYGYPPDVDQYLRSVTHHADPGSIVGRTLVTGSTVHIYDVLSDPEYKMGDVARKADIRTALSVPLLREGTPIGVIVLARRDVRPFTDAQIALLNTFADQAVIAIENVRLFDEVQKRTEDLQESLAQQTATADVLKVISRSAFDLKVVLQTLVESAARLCEADKATVARQQGGMFIRSESFGFRRTLWNTPDMIQSSSIEEMPPAARC